MATVATHKVCEKVEKTIIEDEWRDEYLLKLSEEEAEVLAAVLARIGGDPDGTYRGVTKGIGDALFSAGVKCQFPEKWFTGYLTGKARS